MHFVLNHEAIIPWTIGVDTQGTVNIQNTQKGHEKWMLLNKRRWRYYDIEAYCDAATSRARFTLTKWWVAFVFKFILSWFPCFSTVISTFLTLNFPYFVVKTKNKNWIHHFRGGIAKSSFDEISTRIYFWFREASFISFETHIHIRRVWPQLLGYLSNRKN